jgi:transcriptional regulator with XRE-family HTH domain
MKFTFLDFMELSEKIKELRKKRDWSQEIVANKLNISLNSYGALERGETDIKLSRLEELAGIFEVDISFFSSMTPKKTLDAKEI